MYNKNILFLSGNEALAFGAWEAGLKVACAYPGTPSSEILEFFAAEFDEVDSQWSVNEKVAYEVAYAASVGGVRSLYASKHVGVNVAMDPLMTSSYMGVNAGFVIVSADDPGIHSSQNEQDNRYIARFAKIPLIEPSNPTEARLFIKKAFEISENFDTPVLFRMTTRISHTKENVEVGNRVEALQRNFKIDIPKYVMVPKNAYNRHYIVEKRYRSLKDFSNASDMNKIEYKDKKIGFITNSVSYLYVKEMYPDASIFKLGFSYPFPDKKALEFASNVKELYAIEELEPFIEEQLLQIGIKPKVKNETFMIGELRPEYIPYIVKGESKPDEKAGPARKPSLCKECPHDTVFNIIKKYNPVCTGDIGCYTLGALPPLNALHTCLCMGASITFMEGLQKAHKEDKIVAVIGDSTFVHTGIAGLINAVYNKAKGVVFILDNSTTAMTGSQPHPATGYTIKGEETKKLILEDVCRSCGVDGVDVVNPHKTEELDAIIKKRINEDGLFVIITRFPCLLAKKKLSKIKRG
jgi:indolepyruvate ferredoxin oxidoreductase alpha subunit